MPAIGVERGKNGLTVRADMPGFGPVRKRRRRHPRSQGRRASELCDHVDRLIIGLGHSGPAGRVVLGGTGRSLLHDGTYPILVVARPVG